MPSDEPKNETVGLEALTTLPEQNTGALTAASQAPDGGSMSAAGLDTEAFASVLEAGGDALIVLDGEWQYFYANDLALTIHGKAREGMVGKRVLDVFPEVEGTPFWEIYHRAVRERASLTIEDYFAPLDTWFDIRVIPHGSLLYLLFRDVTAQKKVEATRGLAEEQLRLAQTRLEAALWAGKIATWTIDLVNNRVTGDAYLAYLFSVDPAAAAAGVEPIQTYFNAIHEDDRAYAVESTNRAILYGAPYEPDVRVVLQDGSIRWIASRGKITRDADGSPVALVGAVIDITESKQLEERYRVSAERERARLTNMFTRAPAFMASLRGPQHVYEMANPLYLKLIGRQDVLGKTVAEVIPEMVEHGFIALLDNVYQSGEAFVGNDTSVAFQADPDSPFDEHFVDFTFQPLFDEADTTSGILVHGVDLTDRKRLEQERERLLEEQRILLIEAQARADRETLLNTIGAEVRAEAEPEAILRAAVSALGQGLGADRCYFVRYNQTRDKAHVSPEWLRDPERTQALFGRNLLMSTFSVDRDNEYRAGATHVVDDVIAYAPDDTDPLLSLNIRSLLRVPIEVGDQMTALAVSMASQPRHWTEDEIRLVENVAVLLHSALETALVQSRERNIAQQLQAALQPVPPSNTGGLALASFYRPALAESSVGGDFFDVFCVDEGRTALVVADLSGKGLQAASQVSTVRNMLRFALYSKQRVLDAVNGLHHVLVENELLSGFATLFVGVYDQRSRELTYVNCGQEAGLVWRAATGEVESLIATGPVLGGFIAGEHADATVTLTQGDIIFAGTDGMTEVGPNRKQFLQASGLAALFAQCAAEASADEIREQRADDAATLARDVKERLIAGVEAHAGNVSRLADDIALLVGVVQ